MDDAAHAELFKLLYNDRPRAHEVLFKHRRTDATPDFHRQLIIDWHGPERNVLDLVFRGGAKSTIAEEAMLLRAGFREFKNGLIIGETSERASERLAAIRHEVETNDALADVFGDLMGSTWGDGELVLANGVRIKAMGRGQAIRGIKHNDIRPDALFVDDLEDNRSVRSPEGRKTAWLWFMTELLPACDPKRFVRIAATPLHIEAVAVRLSKDPKWKTKTFPIVYLDAAGKEQPTWPSRFPLDAVELERQSFSSAGMAREFDMEFMCRAQSEEAMAFKNDYLNCVEPTVKTWQATYAMFDPARTTNENSATTGFACWSWINSRLVVWDAWAKKLMPDEIVQAIFQCDADHRPVLIGVEEDGLNQFLMQPIRHEQARRGQALPVQALRAPRSKLDFIKGLQPFFVAREVRFAKELPDLKRQFLNFPTGAIDAPNALAYALKMRPGAPIYEDFTNRHVGEGLRPSPGQPVWLSLNASRSMVSGVLLQILDGCVRIYADWVREGEPGAVLPDIVAEAQIEAGRQVRLIGGPLHFDTYNNVGLKQAAGKLPAELRRGVTPESGRDEIRRLLRKEQRGMPALIVCEEARWTLNGFAGGYARILDKQGRLTDYADDGPYRLLMEGMESFAGLLRVGSPDGEGDDRNYAYTPGGQRYVSALVRR